MLLDFLSRWDLTVQGLATLAGLAVYVIASHARRQRRHPSAAIAWVVSLALTPYFVPDATLLMALTLAARRGIALDLVLPRRSNHRLADMARPAALREMSAAGARVWLAEAMLHAKAVVIDGELALAGSANLDERSLFLNYELMIAFFRPADVQRFARWIEQQRAAATPYQARDPRAMQELGEGLIRWLAFQL